MLLIFLHKTRFSVFFKFSGDKRFYMHRQHLPGIRGAPVGSPDMTGPAVGAVDTATGAPGGCVND